MTLAYTLSENDLLQNQLINASTSEGIKRKRRLSWIMVCIINLCFSFIFLVAGIDYLARYFLILVAICIVLYPTYQRWWYKSYLKRFVKKQFVNYGNESSTITFSDEFIETDDRTGSSKINIDQLEIVYETGAYFFIKLKSTQSLLLPKDQLDNINAVKKELIDISNKLKIKYISDLSWKWNQSILSRMLASL